MAPNMAGLEELVVKDDVVQAEGDLREATLKHHKNALLGELSNQVTILNFNTAIQYPVINWTTEERAQSSTSCLVDFAP